MPATGRFFSLPESRLIFLTARSRLAVSTFSSDPHRQIDEHRRALADRAPQLYRTVMLLNDPVSKGEPEARALAHHALMLGRKEGIEDLLDIPLRDTAAEIGDLYLYAGACRLRSRFLQLDLPGTNMDLSPLGVRFNGI